MDKFTIDKLVGTNWSDWKVDIRLLLRYHGVDQVVFADTKPKMLTVQETAAAGEAGALQAREAYEKALMAFNKLDTTAMLLLRGTMDAHHKQLTVTCDSARSMWVKLSAVYEQSSSQRLDRLLEDLFTYDGTSRSSDMTTHVSNLHKLFRDVNDELRNQKLQPLPDVLLMSRIMSTLPPEFFEFKTVWESIALKDRTVELLTERLRMLEIRVQKRDEATASTALKVSSKQYGPQKATTSAKGSNRVKPGTLDHASRRRKTHNEASSHSSEESTESTASSLFATSHTRSMSPNVWCIDSGATFHMTGNKRLLQATRDLKVTVKIGTASGKVLKAESIGDTTLNMGTEEIPDIILLRNVRYVPGLKANLISCRQLAIDKQMTVTFARDTCQVHNSAGIVVATATLANDGLYCLRGSSMSTVTFGRSYRNRHCTRPRVGKNSERKASNWTKQRHSEAKPEVPEAPYSLAVFAAKASSSTTSTPVPPQKARTPHTAHEAVAAVNSKLLPPRPIPRQVNGSRHITPFQKDSVVQSRKAGMHHLVIMLFYNTPLSLRMSPSTSH